MILDTLKWIGLYAGIGLIASLLLPFPISLAVALGAFIAINFLITRLRIRKKDTSTRSLFDSLSSSSDTSSYNYSTIRYYCMGCGNDHKDITCSVCGSKMKRAEWEDNNTFFDISSTFTVPERSILMSARGSRILPRFTNSIRLILSWRMQ